MLTTSPSLLHTGTDNNDLEVQSMVHGGLDGVVVADTQLSLVDGEAGELVIRGQRLERFASLGFETAAELLLGYRPALGAGREKAYQLLRGRLDSLWGRPPIEALRLGLAELPSRADAALLIGSFPVLLAATRQGKVMLEPDAQNGHVHDLLRMVTGREPEPAEVDGLSRYLVTVCEHGMNASTFTARVIASTAAPLLDAVMGALAALKGPLHGGAPGPVLDLLDELADCPDIAVALRAKIAAGQRLMGFGHRIYRTRDPRAEVLKATVEQLASSSARLRLAEQVEKLAVQALREARPDRVLETNVEFYTAVLLERLGFGRDDFTPLFATGRVLGWIAHYREQQATGRLIRPQSRYVGPPAA
jgi:citrate synthase